MNRSRNIRVREGMWHWRFRLHGIEHTGNTGLAGTAPNRREAQARADAERNRLMNTARQTTALNPFDEIAGSFILWCRTVEYRGKRSTAERIATSFRSAVEYFGSTPLAQIDAAALEGYKAYRIEEHKVRDITLRHDLHALSVFYRKYALKFKLVAANPLESVTIPSDRESLCEHVLTASEESAYFEAAYRLHAGHLRTNAEALPNTADIARLMLEQGCRPDELLSARCEHFDAAKGTLLIAGGKTRAARRLLNLTGESIAILSRRAKLDSPWLFPSHRRAGEHLTKLNSTHDRVCREAGVSFRLYDLRHTWATRAIESGADVPTVAAMLGHSGMRTIFRYVHPTAETKKAAMERFEAAQQRRKFKVVGK